MKEPSSKRGTLLGTPGRKIYFLRAVLAVIAGIISGVACGVPPNVPVGFLILTIFYAISIQIARKAILKDNLSLLPSPRKLYTICIVTYVLLWLVTWTLIYNFQLATSAG
ncbi:MAG: hypothetical protein J7L98_04720 [Candidatus Verstraetearchaeota archaeon]|nr:hypothetical protein [Candidatus Verstraetearchaeota archaeon]